MKNLWEFLGDFLLVQYFQNMIEGVPLTWGHTPLFHFGLKFFFFFLAVIHLFDIAYLSKWFNYSETPSKIINYGPGVQRLRDISGTFYKSLDGVDTY